MFGPAGHAYVYLVYGMYDCLNVVTEPAGEPAAVLVRAIEPLEGVESMRIDRVLRTTARRHRLSADQVAAAAERIARLRPERLASGPGLVAAAFGLDTRWTGTDLCDASSALRLESPDPTAPRPIIETSPRIGIEYAGPDWAARPWRFSERGHPSVSGR